MPLFETKNFGLIDWEAESAIEFPRGLPGFEQRRCFLPIRTEATEPLIYLQSLEDPSLCFLTLPVLAVDPAYRLDISDEDLEEIGLAGGRAPKLGPEVLCLVVVSVKEEGPTANLLAPVVVNVSNRRAVQAIAPHSAYVHDYALLPQEATAC
jgi:flagellar assembly factor FliW